MIGTNTMDKEEIVYAIAVEDIQYAAIEKIGRELTEEEMGIARKGLESGIGMSLDIIYETIFGEML
jgi:hypothetical protein